MKRVLCGISQYPDDNNKMLARRLSVNTSTISTARQRLKDRNLTEKSYIPSFFNLDMGEVVVASGKYRYSFPDDIRESIIGFVTHPALPFLIVTDNTSWMVMGIIPPDMSESQKDISSSFGDKYIYDMTFDLNNLRFKTHSTKVTRYFDYSHLLCKTFNVNPGPLRNNHGSEWAVDELKRNERIILNSLISDSEPSDFQRSQRIGISHPTITKIRKSLIERGIIKTIVKPNLGVFGYSIFAWFNIKHEGRSVEKSILANLCSYPNNILSIYNDDNIFVLSVFDDMKDLMQGQKKIDDFMSSAMISYEDFASNYFSLENPGFDLKSSLTPANQLFTEIPINQSLEPSVDQEVRLNKILSEFLSQSDVQSITGAIKKSVNSKDQKKNPSENTMSMILELLTEPSYLAHLKMDKRLALQAKLIEKLNALRGLIEIEGPMTTELKRKRILIVEDSKPMVELLKDMFKDANLNVLGAVDNGQGAFDLYKKYSERKQRPDIVLIDIFLKGLNGIEATRMIKDFDPKASIIVLTSSLDSRIKNQMTTMGVDEYLIKPVTKAQLLGSIEQVVSKRKGMTK
jgi:two-component system chemotaxis response regulator CheY